MNTDRVPVSLYLAMLCQFAVGGAVIPFAGLLLRERGLSYGESSQIFALASSMLLVFPFLWGMVADRFVPIDRLFTILNALAFGAMWFLYQQGAYVGLLLGFLMFYSCYHPTFTLINALCFHHLPKPEQQFGKVRAWGSLGWIVPSLPISIWLALREGVELGFVLWIGMAAAAAMTLVTLVLPRTAIQRELSSSDGSTKPHYWQDIKVLMSNGNYVAILISFFLISGSFSLMTYYSPPYLVSLGMAREWIGPVQCIGVVLEIALFPFLRVLLARWGYRVCILLGILSLVIRHLLYASSNWLLLLALSYLFSGLFIVFYHISVSILVNEMASRRVRASAQTLLVLLGSGLGPLVTNWVAGRFVVGTGEDLTALFLFAAGLAGMASVVIGLRGRKLEPDRSVG